MKFTHLHVHSHYSLLDGLPKIHEIISHAKALGMESIALTDHGSMYGAVEFYQKAKKAGIKPIIGTELYLAVEKMEQKRANIDDKRYHILFLVKNEEGYKNLVQLVTRAHLDGFYYKPRIDKDLLRKHAAGLICTSACIQGEIPQAILSANFERARALTKEYIEIFGKENFYLELGYHKNIPAQEKANAGLIALAKEFGIGLIATNDVHYLKHEDAQVQDILMAVQTGHRLGEGDRLSLKADDFSMRSFEEMSEYFSRYPEVFENIQKISDACHFEFDLNKTRLPHYELPEGETADRYLEKLCRANLEKRYGKKSGDKNIEDRLQYELSVIAKTGFASYFLIVQDFVNWAKRNKIVVGPGRGSAAGSIVSYVLNITNIDPIKYHLLFERFLNPDRISLPDIDLDFADTRRDEVIHYVAQKYGRHNVAQIITFGTMAARASIRDTGRALGYEYAYCDKVAKMIPFNPTQGMKEGWLDYCLENVKEFGEFYKNDEKAKQLIDAAKKLEGVVRHASTHACGVVISDEPLHNIVPLQRATQNEDIIVTQYEMHSIEDLGLLKMDFLGLKNLTIIENALKIIKASRGIDINIDAIDLDDERTYRLCREGRTTGVFQFESGGMKRYLKELRPTELDDLIAMVALYRPGPLEAGMVPKYIDRKNGKEKVAYLHPKLEPILKNTYGIGVYQEQMMQIARDLAGYTLAEADTLRKAIGKKIKELLDAQEKKLIEGMLHNGIPEHIAKEIWELFPSFARYGFNRSHAACYALIGYQTAYLKAHYPTEFMASLLTAELADIERIAFLVEEAKSMGIEVLPPDINESHRTFTAVSDKKIRFGLSAVKNVGENIVRAIIDERSANGPFSSMSDFASRVQDKDMNKKSLESLVKCGAFDKLGIRNKFLENMEAILSFARDIRKTQNNGQTSLFGGMEAAKPQIKMKDATPASEATRLAWEKELLGLYISGHPLAPYKDIFRKNGIKPIGAVKLAHSDTAVLSGGIITLIQQKVTKKGNTMLFVTLEDTTGGIEMIVFASVLEKNREIWKEGNIILARGKTSNRDGILKIICEDAKLPNLAQALNHTKE